MKKTHIVAGIVLMLLGASTLVTAYHIPENDDARIWDGGTGELVIVCESMGQGDKVNPLLTGPQGGTGGLCFASSQHIPDKEDWKEKKEKIVQDEDGEFIWGAVEPKCTAGLPPMPCGPNKINDTVGEDWFARINSNTRGCNGAWGQTFVYKEVIAYYGGAGPNPDNGISGHVTFFVQDATALEGTYNFNKFEEDPRDLEKTDATDVDPITGLPIEACNGNDVGLCDDSLKDVGRCDGAAKHVKD